MVDPTQIREHLEVVGSDGEHVHLNVTRDDARARRVENPTRTEAFAVWSSAVAGPV